MRDLETAGGTRAKWLGAFLCLFILIEGATAISRAFTIALLSGVRAGVGVDPAAAQADDDRTALLAVVYLLILLVTMIAYCLWLRRASQRAHAVSGGNMGTTPGWAIGWHFVPFANLVMPFRTMVEIWKVSANPHDPEAVLWPEALLRGWWGLWLAGNFAANIAWRFNDPDHLDLLIFGQWLDMFSSLFAIGAGALLMVIVRRIEKLQGESQRVMMVFA